MRSQIAIPNEVEMGLKQLITKPINSAKCVIFKVFRMFFTV